ncbi:MAG: metal ABC transporter substrate-binding protein [Deltaproteobacteria bacterium]|uniref:metal ABC transporter substrate-binding protein n=1 Tax=Candidatus Deferrimicrobium sp. TaxID=3060586 RepID=UPI0027239F7E|nr:metal ABC transporter substrate-binding protein [Candidatus Deferrimicrobium sp.]MCR4309761.1 metal ABC transporter substrate-binding protein [Deltaproteobacteria bacterium]MDO8738345.1 metal ABC transporter substrate-binding protein [Candidatus Deferrimicrobium sp.]
MTAAVFFIALLLALAPSSGRAEPMRVLASFFPMEVFTRNVVGDTAGVTVMSMLPASLGCPHDYALTPGDMKKIASADLFVANGLGMEEFLGGPVRRANPKIRIVETARAVLPIHGGHGHGDVNPHTWVSPRNAILQVREIEKALSAARPVSSRAFRRNADAFVSRLSALAVEFETAAKTFRRRNIVTFHNVFGYLARDLGLTVVGEIETAPGQEPSAGEIRKLSRTIRERKVPAVFSEPQYSPKLADALAREAGVPVRVLDPVATGSPALTAYEDAMRRNLATLKEALATR